MRLSQFIVTLICAAAVSGLPLHAEGAQRENPAADVTAYTDAMVFDGERFSERTVCASGRLIVACTDKPENTISLAGLYLTPPFGDAHTHHFDGSFTLPWHRSLAIESGAFYAMTMTSPTKATLAIRDQFSGPGNIDVATSLGGITGPQSHPAEIYEALALGFRSYEEQLANMAAIRASRLAANDAYFIVQTPQDARSKLSLLLESDPDHIKVFLRHSERYAEGWGKWGPGGGIDPKLLPLIVDVAKASGKRVAIATSTVFDYRESLSVKADLITHLPCYQDTEEDPDSPYFDVDVEEECLLTGKDAQEAASVGMASTLVVTEWAKSRPSKYVEWEKANIDRLREAGARLLVSVDAYGSTLTEGMIAGVKDGYLTPVEMLRIASMDTPQFIFPERKVGCLHEGCSASFIAFGANPLEDFRAIGDISFRLKDGEQLSTDPR